MNADTLVWFRHEDHAGLVRRLVACLIDAGLLLAISSVPPWIAQSTRHGSTPTTTAPVPVSGVAVAILALVLVVIMTAAYHLPLRRTRGGTIGYRLAGQRLVNMAGQTPRWGTLVRRFALSLIFPLLLYALLIAPVLALRGESSTTSHRTASTPGQMIGGAIATTIVLLIALGNYWMIIRDPRRQALHDKWSRTWVVRSEARPAGSGVAIERAWILGPLVLGYWDVEPAEITSTFESV